MGKSNWEPGDYPIHYNDTHGSQAVMIYVVIAFIAGFILGVIL